MLHTKAVAVTFPFNHLIEFSDSQTKQRTLRVLFCSETTSSPSYITHNVCGLTQSEECKTAVFL